MVCPYPDDDSKNLNNNSADVRCLRNSVQYQMEVSTVLIVVGGLIGVVCLIAVLIVAIIKCRQIWRSRKILRRLRTSTDIPRSTQTGSFVHYASIYGLENSQNDESSRLTEEFINLDDITYAQIDFQRTDL